MHTLTTPLPITTAGRAAVEMALSESDCGLTYDVIKVEVLDLFEVDLAAQGIVGADLIGTLAEYGYMPMDYVDGQRAWPRFRRDAAGWSLIGFGFASLGPADEIRLYTPSAQSGEDVFEVHGSFDGKPDRIIVGHTPSIVGPAGGVQAAQTH